MADPLASVPDVPSVDATKAKELVEEKSYALLDVRTVEEYEKGHVAGSVNVPYLFFKQDGTKEVSMELGRVCKVVSTGPAVTSFVNIFWSMLQPAPIYKDPFFDAQETAAFLALALNYLASSLIATPLRS